MSTLTETPLTQSRLKSIKHADPSSVAEPLTLNAESPATTARKTSTSPAEKSTIATLSATTYTHKPSLLILAWLIISLPLILWDTLYVHLRPFTMPGGKLHAPLWTLYATYGRVDHVYGWPAWNSHNGFTAAQSAMNIPESVFYCWYLYAVGRQVVDWTYEGMSKLQVKGKGVDLAVLLCFSAAVMTVSKSMLYWLNEAFSGFASIGHNSISDLFWLWIVPNGLWIVLPGYMIYVFGSEILESMSANNRNGRKVEKQG